MSGAKIIEGLRQAVSGDFARVTIEGKTWIRMPDREAMAKIIDPYAWSDPDNMTPTERTLFDQQSAHRRDTAYGKATAILNLPHPSDHSKGAM